MRKKILYSIWTIVFITGSFLSLLYVQGWRIDSDTGELTPTGIIDFSTRPSDGTAIFINGEYVGESPLLLRGYPLGNITVRFTRSGHHDAEFDINVRHELITRIRNYHLQPQDSPAVVVGPESQIIWDAERRGYVRYYPGLHAFEVHDLVADSIELLEFPEAPEAYYITEQGDLHLAFGEGQTYEEDVFSDRLFLTYAETIAKLQYSSDRNYQIDFTGTHLYQKELKTDEIREIAEFESPILEALWLPGSDDIVIVTESEIFLWNQVLSRKRQFHVVKSVDIVFFVEDTNALFYNSDGIWERISF